MNEEYRVFTKKADQSFGDQSKGEELTKEENEALSRKKFYDAERDYHLRGEDKESYEMYKPKEQELEEEKEQEEEKSPQDRMYEIDELLVHENDKEVRQELYAERDQLAEKAKEERRQQELEQDLDIDFSGR